MEVEGLFAASDLPSALARAIQLHAARPALSRGDETWTYQRLGLEISRVAEALRGRPGPMLYSPSNTPMGVAIIFGAVAAGKVPVLPDPTWTDAERLEVVRRCGVQTVIAEQELTAPWLGAGARVGGIVLHEVALHGEERAAVTPRPDTAFCRFTSGTTGFSRCLEFSWTAALAAARSWWQAVRYHQDDVLLCLATLNNGLAFNTSLLAALLPGAHLVFHGGPLIPSSLAATTRRFSPTSLVAFPFVYDALAGARHRLELSRLRLAVSSAAPLKPESGAAFLAGYGVPVANYYGLVEAGPCTFNDGSVPGSVGAPLSGVSFKIFAEPGGEAGADERGPVGRLGVKSEAMASGFLDRGGPPLAESLDGDGYYLTNDLASLDARGHLFLHGRLGRLMNIEGRKIDPGEVEQVIRGLSGVSDALVRAETANGRLLIAAYVESAAAQVEDLVEVLRVHLAPYKRPQRIQVLSRFPRSAAGKVLLSQLTSSGEV